MQLYANQIMNKLFNQPIELQQASHARESGTQARRIDCESKHSKMSRLELSRERNATRHLLKLSKKLIEKQIVRSEDPTLKLSPLQSIISSVEESVSSSAVNPEVKFIKNKTFREITDELLMANLKGRSRPPKC